jgi:Sulfotransferase family
MMPPSLVPEILSIVAVIAGTALILSTYRSGYSRPRIPVDESIVHEHGVQNHFSIGERVPLVEFLAAEVRRARNADQRLPHDAVITLTKSDMHRRHWRPKTDGAVLNSADIADADRPLDTALLAPNYWRGKDAEYNDGMMVHRSVLHSSVMKRLVVSRKHRTVFCPIFGVASSSLLEFLERADGSAPGSLPSLANFSVRDRERFLSSRDVFRFVIVRHPYMRAVATYNQGIASGDLDSPEYRHFMGLVRGKPLRENERELQKLSMLFFLTFLSKQHSTQLDEQFLSQTELCGIGSINYDLIGRLESLKADVARAANIMKVSFVSLNAIPIDGRRNTTETAIETFASSKHRSKAAKLYSADLTTLNYPSSL